MDRHSIALLMILCVSSCLAVHCPEGPDCGPCHILANDEYEIQCAFEDGPYNSFFSNSVFSIKYRPEEYVTITCNSPPNWDDFHLGKTMPIQRVKSVFFRLCQIPEGNKLGAIVRQLVVGNIDELDITSYENLTSTLTSASLKEFKNIQTLTLSSNSLANVTDDLLQEFTNLRVLNLYENHIRKLPANFLNLTSLQAIELGSNKLDVIEPIAFGQLKNLELLNIWDNRIVEIKPHSFDNLSSLTSLDLHRNKLTTLPSDVFARLTKLKIINLSQNNFTGDTLPDNLLRNNTNLEKIQFYENKRNLTTLPKYFFGNLSKLIEVRMTRNGLTHLPEDLFWGTTALRNLSIERNYLVTLPAKFFRDCHNLSTLDLSFNELRYLPDGIFTSLNKLQRIDLSKNHIESISRNLLEGLSSLKVLNMERNHMKFIDMNAFHNAPALRIASFSYNDLTLMPIGGIIQNEYGAISPFHHCSSHLEELHLAHNNISEVFGDWIFATKLRTLNLAHNNIKTLKTEDFQFLADNIHVDLTHNEVTQVQLYSAELLADSQTTARNVIINIENNPIHCDCELYDLLRYREGRMHPSVQNLFHLKMDNLKCSGPSTMRHIKVTELKSKTLQCEVVNTVTRNASCPNDCDCLIRPENRVYIINCAKRGLTQAPLTIASPPGFQVDLDLSGNLLKEMPSLHRPGYKKITTLSLANNKINEIPWYTVSGNLISLNLENNNLTVLDPKIVNFWRNSTKLKHLALHKNPWKCNCETREFVSYIQATQTKIPELQKVTCGDTATPVFEMRPEELCPMMISWIIGICIGVALLGIIIGSGAAAYYRYQHEIKVWLFANQWCLWFVTENELDKDKIYDAFISYSHKDEEFIVNNLVPKLEQCPRPFKLCVHYRDWPVGELIPQQIMKSVENSRRTIVVISPNFLESVWGKMEFRAAHHQALTEGRARVIAILYGDIGPIENLDAELKAYLSMNTYVQWGDPWFWEKLRYVLPHPDGKIKKKEKSGYLTENVKRVNMKQNKLNITGNNSDESFESDCKSTKGLTSPKGIFHMSC